MVSFRSAAIQAITVALSLSAVDAAPRRVTTGPSASTAQSLGARDPHRVTTGSASADAISGITGRDPRRITHGADESTSASLSARARTNRKGNGNTQTKTAQQQAAAIPGGISAATDGSVILDSTANVNGLDIRFKISGPAARFTTATNVTGAAAAPGSKSDLGINVLLHGDSGQSFFDFPNQGVNENLAGIALLAPNANLFWGGGSGLDRTDGVAHAQAVRDFILEILPEMLSFDPGNVFFTGISGGSLLLSGFFVPAHMVEFPNGGVLLNCGAMQPQVAFNGTVGFIGNTRMHFQSTQNELELLQGSIPDSIAAYQKVAASAGLPDELLNILQTVNNEPVGGHCEFDGKDFVSGVQLMANSYAAVMQGGDGQIPGIGNVLGGTKNTTLSFGKAT